MIEKFLDKSDKYSSSSSEVRDSMELLEQKVVGDASNAAVATGCRDWRYALLLTVPGAAALLYHCFVCRLKPSEESAIYAPFPDFVCVDTVDELLGNVESFAELLVCKNYVPLKDILKKWKKEKKKSGSVEIGSKNIQAVAVLRQSLQVIFDKTCK